MFEVLLYEEAAEGDTIIHFGDEVADKFYHILDGEVSVLVPQPKTFQTANITGENLAYFFIQRYEDICWTKMKNGGKVKSFILQ